MNDNNNNHKPIFTLKVGKNIRYFIELFLKTDTHLSYANIIQFMTYRIP